MRFVICGFWRDSPFHCRMARRQPEDHLDPRQFARLLRHEATDAEARLWCHLRNRGLDGHKFRRQHLFPPYVLDFYCAELALVVELDGGQHLDEAGIRSDAARSRRLAASGLRVLRFSNVDVLANTEGVLDSIRKAATCQARE